MSALGSLVRGLRPATDLVAPYSFNRIGFELNRLGFDPGDLSEIEAGRVALVTGANSGIGLATAHELARLGFDVWLLCRDRERGEQARKAIAAEVGEQRVHLAIVDMASLTSIRRLAQELPLDRIDVLVHNAGALPLEKKLSDDGIELTFATHVVGPFALTQLLMERLSRSSDARVVFVASGGLYPQRLDLSLLEVDAGAFDGVRAYANAKRAQVILTHLLAERVSGRYPITFASMHPGWVDTAAMRASLPRFYAAMRGLLRTAEQGADTAVWLAANTAPTRTNGAFWFDRREALEYPLPFTREGLAEREQLLLLCERLSGVDVM